MQNDEILPPKVRKWIAEMSNSGCCVDLCELHGLSKGYLECQLDLKAISLPLYEDAIVRVGSSFTNRYRDLQC